MNAAPTTASGDAPLSPEAMALLRASAGRACALLKAMANEDRLLLLCQLAEGERNVGELLAHTGVVQPTLSQQLGVLRDEGLVETRREGKFIYYRLASAEVLAVMQALHASLCGHAQHSAPDTPA
ncbi:metalloregulator ArsR/SmtB family transcription factor [Xylophilus sp. GW821-FHT01B05]